MARVADLFALQEVDSELDAVERSLAEARERLGADSEVSAARLRVVELEQEEHTAAAEQRAAEDEVEDARAHTSPVEAKLYGGTVTNSKELRDLQRELETLQRHLQTREEAALVAITRFETAQAQLRAARENADQLTTAWNEEQASLTAEVEQAEREIMGLRERRQAAATLVDAPSLALYEQLRRTRAGRAVARIQRGACLGCHISLPSTIFQKARSGLSVVQCTSCGRILYVG